MTLDNLYNHKEIQKKLWCDVYIAVATSGNCVNIDTPTRWADKALAEFNERFKEPEITFSKESKDRL